MSGATAQRLPTRNEVHAEDTWDLSSLFPDDAAWRAAFDAWEKEIPGFGKYQGTLGRSPARLAECLDFDLEMDRRGERLGAYAHLRMAEDVTNAAAQDMTQRYRSAISRLSQAGSFFRPELLAIEDGAIQQFLNAPELSGYKLLLERILRYKPHTLTEREEKLLAMGGEMAGTAGQIFRQLNDAELKLGEVLDSEGRTVEVSHATFISLLSSPDRRVRKDAFHQYYSAYDSYKNTFAAALSGSIQKDVYYSRARNYPSVLEGALFDDDVPVSVYDSLIESVHEALPSLHRYYDLRKRLMKLDEIHHYDVYVPILSDLEKRRTWDEAVELVLASLAPLGSEYQATLEKGFRDRWCDRYENKGKQSGAFSCGTFTGRPYILMNYKENLLDHVFTLTHEAGHSMHSHYSAKHQPFAYYNYTTFVAEVASTFNEQLLSKYMMEHAADERERAFLVNREIDQIRGTIIRQTMFAEFERVSHALCEANEPLSLAAFRSEYRKLLERYFGPEFTIDPVLELECLRIPHFYRAFYVYKYATGLSAAIALSDRVTSGGPEELAAYLNFLKSGCSKYPLELLRDAGVDLSTPAPVRTALARFDKLVDELDSLMK